MLLKVKAANDCDAQVKVVDEYGHVLEKFVKDRDTCLIETQSDVSEVDISFKSIPLVKNKVLLILGYTVFYIIRFILRLMAGKHGGKADFFQDTTIEGVHTRIKLYSDRTEPISIIYKSTNVTKNKTFEMGKVYGTDENLDVKYIIDLEAANKSFRTWVRDTLLLIGPVILILIWLIILAWINGNIDIAIFLIILDAVFMIAMIRLCVKNRKSLTAFVSEWNEKERYRADD